MLDQTARDASGYLTSSATPYSTATYALESDDYRAGSAGEWFVARALLGTIRIHSRSGRPVFIGIAPAAAASRYLAHVAHAQAADLGARSADFRVHPGGAPSALPATRRFWVARASGSGEQTLTWKVRGGDWRVIVMNADGTREVASALSVGASFPHLAAIGVASLGAGIVLLLLAGGAMLVLLRRGR